MWKNWAKAHCKSMGNSIPYLIERRVNARYMVMLIMLLVDSQCSLEMKNLSYVSYCCQWQGEDFQPASKKSEIMLLRTYATKVKTLPSTIFLLFHSVLKLTGKERSHHLIVWTQGVFKCVDETNTTENMQNNEVQKLKNSEYPESKQLRRVHTSVRAKTTINVAIRISCNIK